MVKFAIWGAVLMCFLVSILFVEFICSFVVFFIVFVELTCRYVVTFDGI